MTPNLDSVSTTRRFDPDSHSQRRIAHILKPALSKFRRNSVFLLMVLPGVALLFVFSYLPMFGSVIAFKDYRHNLGILGSEWVGFQNFDFLFGTSTAWRVTFNTLFLNLLFILTVMVAAIILAILMNEVYHTLRARIYQSILFFPYFLSWVVVSYIVFVFLSTDNGVINQLLQRFDAPVVSWYQTPVHWRVILTLVNLWKHAGFWSIVYLAGILGISPEYYEAATIDGAGKLQQHRFITLPLLLPIITINVLLSIGRIFYVDFGLFYHVTRDSGLLYSTTDVIDTYVFRTLRVTGNVSMAAAAGLYQSVIGFVLVVIANWIVRRIDPDRALF